MISSVVVAFESNSMEALRSAIEFSQLCKTTAGINEPERARKGNRRRESETARKKSEDRGGGPADAPKTALLTGGVC